MSVKGIRKLTDELWHLRNPHWDPEVLELCKKVLKRREPEIAAKLKEIEDVKAKRPEKKPRWPEDTPRKVLDACQRYWSGSEEYRTFRIHMWNDIAAWTSYPSGGFWQNDGYHKASATFYLIKLEFVDRWRDKCTLRTLEGRVSKKTMQEELDKVALTKARG